MIDHKGEELAAPEEFMLVVSYNPGYQNVLKRMKPSTRQRFLSITFDFPKSELETAVVAQENRLDEKRVASLVRLGGHIRALSGMDLKEGVLTRLLIYPATLMANGMGVTQAIEAAIFEPFSDDSDLQTALRDLLEPEEAVGNLWHDMTNGIVAAKTYPDAAVLSSRVHPSLAILFRASGGDAGVRLGGARATLITHRRAVHG